jgi:hypothetical protein
MSLITFEIKDTLQNLPDDLRDKAIKNIKSNQHCSNNQGNYIKIRARRRTNHQ